MVDWGARRVDGCTVVSLVVVGWMMGGARLLWLLVARDVDALADVAVSDS